MGELINLTSSMPLTDADIPATIARDTETVAAIATHAANVDPHPIYLTQVEGNALYPQLKRAFYTLITPSTLNSTIGSPHGLTHTKIRSISSFATIDLSNSAGFVPMILPGGLPGLSGYYYSISLDINSIYCRLSSDSFMMFSRSLSVVIDYIA
ncbi:MAG: hypothetical protein WBL95_21135 [Microcoleus sp.]